MVSRMKDLRACLLWTIIPYNYAQNLISMYWNLMLVLPKLWFLSFLEKKSVRYLAPVIWISRPWETERIATSYDFKQSINEWKPDCACRICSNYISCVGIFTQFICIVTQAQKCILMGSFLLFKPSSKETTMVKLVFSQIWQSVWNYVSP